MMTKTPELDHRIDALLATMTLLEKVGQLNQIPYRGDDAENIRAVKRRVKNGEVGSIILATGAFAGNDQQAKTRIAELNDLQRIAMEESRMSIPLLVGRDVIHGHHTVFPIPLAMAAAFNPRLVRDCYRHAALEASNDGINWAFAPMLDLSRDPRWGRCIESPGEDPHIGGRYAAAAVEGFQGDDYKRQECIAACAKHYIGYGASEGGRDYHKTEISDYGLRNYYLTAFKAAVKANVATVMCAFNEVSGQPATSSKYLLTDVLKKELGFDGFVESDWGAIEQLQSQGVAENRKECARLAINAGIDMDMVDGCYYENLVALIKDGTVSEQTLNEAVGRVLRIKLAFGLFDRPYTVPQPVDARRHLDAARELAGESIILLKNKNALLPLAKNARIALIGPMVNERKSLLGNWALDGDANAVTTLKESLKEVAPEATIETADSGLADDMLMLIKHAEVVVLALGESYLSTGETHGICDLELPAAQAELVKSAFMLGKPVVGIMCFGRPVALERIEPYFTAILYAWHGGTRAGAAIADVLFGNRAPSGKLPMTMPRRTGQVPIYYNFPGCGRPVNDYYGGTATNYEDCLGSPLYPFGFGLSYTTFEYSGLHADARISWRDLEQGRKIPVEVTIKNTGHTAAQEVVQCYVRDVVASMTRPLRELKGFQKIELQPEETKRVIFDLGKDELGFYNGDGQYVVEPGTFEIYVGGDCLTRNVVSVEVIG